MVQPTHEKKIAQARAPLNIGATWVVNPTSRGFAAVQHDIWLCRPEYKLDLVCELGEQARPIEVRAGIGLAAGRDIAVGGELAQGKDGLQLRDQAMQFPVLRI